MNNLVEARRKAEQAVQDMTDGELKVKAFETILNHLLSGTADPVPRPARVTSSKTSAPKGTAKPDVPGVPKSMSERILFLKSESFFDSQKSIDEIRQELKKNGWHYPVTSLSGALQSLIQKRHLRRTKERLAGDKKNSGWKYSNP